jgi:hypothetical protein
MSIHAKRAGFVITVLLAITMYRAFGDFTLRRSANDAFVGVSFDSTAVIEFIVLSALVCLFFFWQHRQHSGVRQSSTPRP